MPIGGFGRIFSRTKKTPEQKQASHKTKAEAKQKKADKHADKAERGGMFSSYHNKRAESNQKGANYHDKRNARYGEDSFKKKDELGTGASANPNGPSNVINPGGPAAGGKNGSDNIINPGSTAEAAQKKKWYEGGAFQGGMAALSVAGIGLMGYSMYDASQQKEEAEKQAAADAAAGGGGGGEAAPPPPYDASGQGYGAPPPYDPGMGMGGGYGGSSITQVYPPGHPSYNMGAMPPPQYGMPPPQYGMPSQYGMPPGYGFGGLSA